MSTQIGHGVIPVTLDPSAVQGGLLALGAKVKAKLGAAGMVGGAALTAGIGVAVAAGAGLIGVGKTFEEVNRIIIRETGASGKTLDSLNASVKRIGVTTPASFEDVGVAVAGLNTRLGLTGKPLEAVSTNILNLSRLTGTDLKTNVAAMTRMFGDWSIPTNQQATALDKVYKASQETGIGVDALSTLMVKFGSPLRMLGLDFDFSAAMFAKFEKEGVNMQTAMPGLRMALKNFAKEGRDPAKALQETFDAIRDAPTRMKATQIAFEVFGTRAGPDLAAAVLEGRFSLDDLMGQIKQSKGTLDDATERTRTMSESWQLFKNRVMVPLAPIAKGIMDTLGKAVAGLADLVGPDGALGKAFGWFGDQFSREPGSLGSKAADAFSWIGDSIGSITPAVQGAGRNIMSGFSDAFSSLRESITTKLAPALQDLWPKIQPVAEALLGAFGWGVRHAITLFGNAVHGALRGLGWLGSRAVDALAGLTNFVSNTVIPGVQNLMDKFGDFKDKVNDVLGPTRRAIRRWWTEHVKPNLSAFKAYLTDDVFPALRKFRDLVGRVFAETGRIIDAWARVTVIPAFRLVRTWVRGVLYRAFQEFYRLTGPGWRTLGEGIQVTSRTVIVPAFRTVRTGLGELLTAFQTHTRLMGVAFWSLARSMVGPVNWIIRNVLNKIIGGVNAVAHALGEPNIIDPFGQIGARPMPRDLANIINHQRGRISARSGTVLPGFTPGRDVLHYKAAGGPDLHLAGGEAIMVPEWTAEHGGPRGVKAENDAARRRRRFHGPLRFAGGGMYPPVPGRGSVDANDSGRGRRSWDYPVPTGTRVHAAWPGVVAAVQHLATSYGNSVWVHSAKRMTEIYAHLSRTLVRPGQNVRRAQVLGLSGSSGNSTGPHLHFEIRSGSAGLLSSLGGIVGGIVGRLFDPVKAILGRLSGITLDGAPSSLARTLGAGVLKTLMPAALRWAGRQFVGSSVGTAASGSVSRWQGTALAVLRELHADPSNLGSVMRRMGQESSGNPRAVNKSDSNWKAGHPSVGLMQVIASTFAAYAGRYRRTGPFLYGVSVNPKANIYAGLNYAKHRYGSIVAGMNQPGGYDQGGIAVGRGWLRKNTPEPERVLSPRETRAFEVLSHALDVLAPALSATATGSGGGGGGQLVRMKITNWDEGEGWMRTFASDEVAADNEFQASRRRQG